MGVGRNAPATPEENDNGTPEPNKDTPTHSSISVPTTLTPSSSPTGPPLSLLHGKHMPELIRNELLSEIWSATVKEVPYKLAMVSQDVQLTYAEVDKTTDSLARGLIEHGAGPGCVVGLWMPRGVNLLMAQIAITKTGAAWLPFDGDAPEDRVATCLLDASARCLLTCAELAPRASKALSGGEHIPVLIDRDVRLEASEPLRSARERGTNTDHAAYLIYTSGSTGKPKGTILTQANACHFVRSTNNVYGVRREDIHYQGVSLAFDLSMEETWIPYSVGATLFVATPQLLSNMEALPHILETHSVTVLNTVPTLLSLLPSDIPSLRLIIVGGEACPPALVNRWWREGRTILNSYGPTEVSVVSTVGELLPGKPVTIGVPIPNYTVYVVSEDMRVLEQGEQGEMLLGGPGVAKGYLNRDSLTAEKFIPNPFVSLTSPDCIDPVLYRSGDAVMINSEWNIEYHGRIDDQVKFRGFRIELGEIEAVLSSQRGINHAAVVLRDFMGLDSLVAFVTIIEDSHSHSLDVRALKAELKQVLPSYMVPSHVEVMQDLPRLHSGKVDRKALKVKALSQPALSATEQTQEVLSETEEHLLQAAKKVLPPGDIPLDADFFTELGGHSLIAARFVSFVREVPGFASITLQDLYTHRTLRKVAEHLNKSLKTDSLSEQEDLSFTPPPLSRRLLCGTAQALVIPFLLTLSSTPTLASFLFFTVWWKRGGDTWTALLGLVALYIGLGFTLLIVSIIGKWLVVGRTIPGRYPLWGLYYFKWWLGQRVSGLVLHKWYASSPLIRFYLRALGAKIGEDALISEHYCAAVDLVEIGEGATVQGHVKFANAVVEGNELVIGRIRIGRGASVGTSCVIGGDVIIGEGARLLDLTSLEPGTKVGDGEIWEGSPGRCIGRVTDKDNREPAKASSVRRVVMTTVFALVVLAVPTASLLPVFPTFWLIRWIWDFSAMSSWNQWARIAITPVMAFPTAFILVLATASLAVLFRWLVLPSRVKEGVYSVWSLFYLRKWMVSLATNMTLDALYSMCSTLYIRSWYRYMGARIGRDAEVSSFIQGPFDLVNIGKQCFVADNALIGDENLHNGWLHLEPMETGERTFLGNDCVIPLGSRLPSSVLIGVRSKMPEGEGEIVQSGDTWFGTPPICLPTRQVISCVSDKLTFCPPLWRKVMRGAYEGLSISLPPALFITFSSYAVDSLTWLVMGGQYAAAIALFIFVSTLISLAMCLCFILLKWLTVGRVGPTVKPMWDFWSIRTECNSSLSWPMAGRTLLGYTRGTPLLPVFLRLLGAEIGRGVFMDTLHITEFDCVSVGDYCAVNMMSSLQTHLYEDRMMKVGRVRLGRGVTVNMGCTVLYDTLVEDFATLGPLTVVMKGERIPRHTRWVGSPALRRKSRLKVSPSVEKV